MPILRPRPLSLPSTRIMSDPTQSEQIRKAFGAAARWLPMRQPARALDSTHLQTEPALPSAPYSLPSEASAQE